MGQIGLLIGQMSDKCVFHMFSTIGVSNRDCSFRGAEVGVQEEVPGCVTCRSPIPALGHAGIRNLCC